VTDVRLFDVGQACGFDQLRNPDQPRLPTNRQPKDKRGAMPQWYDRHKKHTIDEWVTAARTRSWTMP
jgi:hypothetical protein